MARRPRRLGARPALEEHEERPVEAVGVGDLAREDRDALAAGARVVERDGQLVLGEDEPVGAVRRGDPRILYRRTKMVRLVAPRKPAPAWLTLIAMRSVERPFGSVALNVADE